MAKEWFEHASDVLAGFLPRAFREHASAVTSRNLKVWYDEPREHYEIQFIARKHAKGFDAGRHATVLEIGFHAEHPRPGSNDAVLERVMDSERAWRRALGRAPAAGGFLGRKGWTRVSEVWDGDEIYGIEAATEAAERLARYIAAIEPARRGRGVED